MTRRRRTPLPIILEEAEISNVENAKNGEADEALAFAQQVILLKKQHNAQKFAQEALIRAGVSVKKPLWVTAHH
jgi:hypothetical protein